MHADCDDDDGGGCVIDEHMRNTKNLQAKNIILSRKLFMQVRTGPIYGGL